MRHVDDAHLSESQARPEAASNRIEPRLNPVKVGRRLRPRQVSIPCLLRGQVCCRAGLLRSRARAARGAARASSRKRRAEADRTDSGPLRPFAQVALEEGSGTIGLGESHTADQAVVADLTDPARSW